MKRFYLAEGKETPDGEYMLVADHKRILNHFERLWQFAYLSLAQAHQVLWEVDRIPAGEYPWEAEVVQKTLAMYNRTHGNVSEEEYNALVRDAMRWRSSGLANPRPIDP